jgi:PPOX class F420-dependent enzyme/OxyR family protein
MSVFTDAELAYLLEPKLAHLATAGADGQPHITPVTYHYNEDEDAIDVGGVSFGRTKKFRDAVANPKVTILLDDVLSNPRRARALEVRGTAEVHRTGGGAINPRFPNFDPAFLRIRPTRVVSWGLEEGGVSGEGFRPTARWVGEQGT